MPVPRLCEYVVLQVAPDPLRDELINVGVALRETQGDFVAVHVTPDFRRVRCLFPNFEPTHLAGLKETLESALRRDPQQWAYQAEETFSQSLRVGRFHGLATANPMAAARELYRRLVQAPMARPAAGAMTGRRGVAAKMEAGFARAGLLPYLQTLRSAAELGLANDPYRFDFYYRKAIVNGGHPHVVMQAVDLGGSVGRIKELCFTVQSLRRQTAEGLEARAVHDEAAPPLGTALPADYLRQAGIELLPLAASAALAERVRADLHLSPQ